MDGWMVGRMGGQTEETGSVPTAPLQLTGASLTAKVSKQAQLEDSQVGQARGGRSLLAEREAVRREGAGCQKLGATFSPGCLVLGELASRGNAMKSEKLSLPVAVV